MKLIDFLAADFTKIEKKHLFIGLFITTLILVSIWLITTNHSTIITEQYFQDFSNIQLHKIDAQTWGSNIILFSTEKFIYHFVKFLPDLFAIVLYSLLLLLSFNFFYEFLIENRVSKDIVVLTLIFFTLSPVFLYSIISLSNYVISFFILSLFLYFDSKAKWLPVQFILILIVATMEFYTALLFFMFYFTFSVTVKKYFTRRIFLFISGFILFLFLTSLKISLMTHNNFFGDFDINLFGVINGLISDLGAISGTNIFFFILAFIGFFSILVLKNKLKFYFIFIFIFLILHNNFMPFYDFYFVLLITVFSAIGYIIFKERQWSDTDIKFFTLLLIVCGILFSLFSFYNKAYLYDINQNQLDFFENLNLENKTVVTHPNYAVLMKYFGAKVLADKFDDRYDSLDSVADLDSIFRVDQGYLLDQFISKYSVDYFLITSEMKSGLVWDYKNDQLNFFLNSNERFDLVKSDSFYQLYEVKHLK